MGSIQGKIFKIVNQLQLITWAAETEVFEERNVVEIRSRQAVILGAVDYIETLLAQIKRGL